jgi:pimeloyl-ACP methyl ester carboxylesterase
MERLELDDVELTYEARGQGDRVVLIHSSSFVSWYSPLVENLPDFSVLRYRRRLRYDSTSGFRPLTVSDDAGICSSLMEHVDWPTAHVVGHSYGALVALELAKERRSRVRSVALLEPAARGVSSSERVVAALQPVIDAYRTGDREAAVDGFLRTVGGDDYRAALDRLLPEAFGEAVAEADLFFQVEMPAVGQWSFGPADAKRITQPVLNVIGAESVPRFVEGGQLVQSWFPQAERFVLPNAGHLLMLQNPAAMAQGLRDFFMRHPIVGLGPQAGPADVTRGTPVRGRSA